MTGAQPGGWARLARERGPRALAALAVLAVLFGNGGFRSLVSNWRELRRLRAQIARLDRDESALEDRLKALRAGDSGVEGAARRDLGYIKKGEIEYRFPPPGQQGP